MTFFSSPLDLHYNLFLRRVILPHHADSGRFANSIKLGIHVCNRTIQKYMRHVRTPRPGRQKWATFLHHHAAEFWACDFLQVTDPFFRSLFAFFVIELKSRKVIHMAFTKFPTDAWVAQQLREATPYGQVPKYLMHDHDTQFGPAFARRAATSSIQILRTPYHAPCANTVCERFLGSVRRECLDHILVLHENHVYRVLQDDVEYFNHARPHQGIKQEIPEPQGSPVPHDHICGQVIVLPILGGLHHNYRRTA